MRYESQGDLTCPKSVKLTALDGDDSRVLGMLMTGSIMFARDILSIALEKAPSKEEFYWVLDALDRVRPQTSRELSARMNVTQVKVRLILEVCRREGLAVVEKGLWSKS